MKNTSGLRIFLEVVKLDVGSWGVMKNTFGLRIFLEVVKLDVGSGG